jgi:CubicO group peptidase (beta-lactamase class C family)
MDDLIDRLVTSAQQQDMELYGVHVYRRGTDPVERRLRSDDRVNLYSVSKTFVSVAIGIAEAEGLLTLDTPALDYLPEMKPFAADGLDQVTIRHLLTMTSGSRHSWFADEPILVADLAADFFATPLENEPGTHFSYTGTGPYVAARALRAATGASVRDYLVPRVFGPLGIHNPQWHTCPLGHPFAESDLLLTTSELARCGRLLLDEGRWEGRQLVPAEYCERMPRESVPVSAGDWASGLGERYGLGVWCGPGDRAFSMAGKYGQLCVISPEHEAVVTITAHLEDGSPRTSLSTLIRDEILARL